VLPGALATLEAPTALLSKPLAVVFVPTATAFVPLAMALTPQPKDDGDAEAPLLVTDIALTTGVVVVATPVKKFPV